MPKMSDDDFARLVSNEITDAENFISRHVAVRRERNYDYFMAATDSDRMSRYLPAAPGQSRAISTDVSDYIGMILPNLMRTAAGSRKIFDYQPKGYADRAAARMASDFINDVVFRYDNTGEAILRQWALDGLVQIAGVVKVWWEDREDVEDYEFSGVSEATLTAAAVRFANDPTVEVQSIELDDETSTYSVKVKRRFNKSKVCFDVVPPEEFIINRSARSLEDATIKLHRTFRRAGDLIEMGFDADTIKALPTFDPYAGTNAFDRLLRDNAYTASLNEDEMLREVAIYEGVVLANKDGSGLKEWYVFAGGADSGVKILSCEMFRDQVYFCDFCPEPLPHMFYGKCPADELVEVQNQATALKRGLLTNVYFGNAPMREVATPLLQEGAMEQLLSPVPNGIAQVKAIGAIREIPASSNAPVTLEAIQYVHQEAERRVGVSQRSAGIGPNRVQNQSATEAMIDYNASLGQIEDYARVWATGGLRKLGRALLRVLKRYQSFERIVLMNGAETPINPQAWAEFEDWDCVVNTGLGSGRRERDSMVVQAIIAKQEQLIQMLGPDNDVCPADMYVQALRDAVELEGMDPDRYFKAVAPGQQIRMPQPPPDPKAMEAQAKLQIEAQKLQFEQEAKRAELGLKREEAQIKIQTETALEAMKAESKAALDKQESDRQFALDVEKMEREHALRREEMELEADLKLISIATKTGSQSTNIPRAQ